MKGDIALKIKGKYFVPPSEFNLSLNELMQLALDCGTGRPVPRDGCVQTKWTPSLLATAITEIDQNSEGVDIRTVQLWFQDNDRGIGQTNLRWLSWVFGCGDPVASRDWMVALSAAKTRTNNSRKNNPTILSLPNANEGATDTLEAETGKSNVATKSKRGFSLARWSETLFSGSPLDLPTAIFAGAVALGLSSYLLGIHNLTIGNSDDLLKQLGFMWAPNWTLLFMVFMPLFFAFIIELVVFWKDEGRLKFLVEADQADSDGGWTHKVESSSLTYWSVFLLCVGFAGIFQWVGVRMIPLTSGGGGDYAIDWGTLALVRPDVISVPQALAFTGFAYLYMCLCFYLFFAGLIILYTLAYDFWEIGCHSDVAYQSEADEIGLRVLRGIFRCTLLGIMVAICMKLESFYVTSSATNIFNWLAEDMRSALNATDGLSNKTSFRRPTHYTSLVVTLATCMPFLYGSVRIGLGSSFQGHWMKMAIVVALLALSYLLIGAFTGFSILLSVGLLVAMYGLFDPAFWQRAGSKQGDNQGVS